MQRGSVSACKRHFPVSRRNALRPGNELLSLNSASRYDTSPCLLGFRLTSSGRVVSVVSGLQGMQEQADMLRDKLADAVAHHQRAREEAAKELAAARVAWEIKRRNELQVCTLSTCNALMQHNISGTSRKNLYAGPAGAD